MEERNKGGESMYLLNFQLALCGAVLAAAQPSSLENCCAVSQRQQDCSLQRQVDALHVPFK